MKQVLCGVLLRGLDDLKALIAKGGLTVRDASINSSNPNDAKSPECIESQILAPQTCDRHGFFDR